MPQEQRAFYREKYLMDGYDACILADEEVDEIIASGKREKPLV